MRSPTALRRASGNPIVLVDELGRMAGLCGDDEIYRAACPLTSALRPAEVSRRSSDRCSRRETPLDELAGNAAQGHGGQRHPQDRPEREGYKLVRERLKQEFEHERLT